MSLHDFFPQNWSKAVELESSWLNEIQQASITSDEERCVLADRPSRMIKVRWTALERTEAQRLVMAFMRAAEDEAAVPLYCDQAVTTAASSGTTIHCPTPTRRFYVGYRLVIVKPDGTYQERTISAFDATTITVTVALTGSFPVGSKAFPLMDCLLALDSDVSFMTDFVGEAEHPWLEVTDERSLPASATDTLPDNVEEIEFPTDTTLPVFPLEIQWAEPVGMSPTRAGERYSMGRGTRTFKQGRRPLMRIRCEVLAALRAEAWTAIQFFDYVRGTTVPFWMLAPVTLLKATAFHVAHVDVEAAGSISDLSDFLRYVAIVNDDGTFALAEVDVVAVAGSDWRITFVDALADVSQAVAVKPAYLVRFAEGAQTEQWDTDGVCRFSIEVREVEGIEENIDIALEDL